MKLDQSFEVEAPIERVWQALIDVEYVAPCLPGAEITGRRDDGTWTGALSPRDAATIIIRSGQLGTADRARSGSFIIDPHAGDDRINRRDSRISKPPVAFQYLSCAVAPPKAV